MFCSDPPAGRCDAPCPPSDFSHSDLSMCSYEEGAQPYLHSSPYYMRNAAWGLCNLLDSEHLALWHPTIPFLMREQITACPPHVFQETALQFLNLSLSDLLSLMQIVMRLGQTMRLTEDGAGNPESVTTHSLMLALFAVELSRNLPVDTTLLLGLSLIHDLPEALCGDTPTLWPLTPIGQQEKDRKEAEAISTLRLQLAAFPWLLSLLDIYEAQSCLEARIVKYVDKILPRLTLANNGCAVPKREGMSLDFLIARNTLHGNYLSSRNPEPELDRFRELFTLASKVAADAWNP